MKIALYGNVCNNMYNIAKALRKHTSIEPHLYLAGYKDIYSRPESDDPHIAGNYPSWIHDDPKWDVARMYKRGDFRLVRELRNYDAVIVSDIGIWVAPYVKGKVFCWTTGADVTRMPFPGLFSFLYPSLPSKIKAWYMAAIQRFSLRYVDQFWTQPIHMFKTAFARLGTSNDRLSRAYFPIIIDTSLFSYNADALAELPPAARVPFQEKGFTVFMPSRPMVQKNQALVDSGNWKNNDLLLYGFRKFLDENPGADAAIVLIDRAENEDSRIMKRIINELQLQDHVYWINGGDAHGFKRADLINLYSCSDIVVDEFGSGAFGSIVVEGASTGRPVMCRLADDMASLYPWHPLLNAHSPESIAAHITRLYRDRSLVEETGKCSREWALEFHSQESAGLIYAREIERLLTTGKPQHAAV